MLQEVKENKLEYEISDSESDDELMGNNRIATNLFQNKSKKASKRAQNYWFIGKSFRGKSHLMKFILMEKMLFGQPRLETVIVFKENEFEKDFDWATAVFNGYDEGILRRIDQNLQKMARQKTLKPNAIVFEDIVGLLKNYTDWFVNWMSRARHTQTSIFMSTQYVCAKGSISTIMREQTTFAFMFRTNNEDSLEALYRAYGGLFENYYTFKYYFQSITDGRLGNYVAMLYMDGEDNLKKNYIPVWAPEQYPLFDIRKLNEYYK